MKQLGKAIPELEKEIALNPYHPSANYVLGHIYLRVDLQHPERAARYLRRAVEAKPDFVEARKQWGRALSLMHEDQKAVEQLELAAREDPHRDTVHYLLASIYRSMGVEDKARKEFAVFDELRGKAPQQRDIAVNNRRRIVIVAAPERLFTTP
jgi:tetratricopeptide (TPR) repeat protein